MHYACAGGFLKCVELLVHSGADVNEVNHSPVDKNESTTVIHMNTSGCTPLMLAAAVDQEGHIVREIVLRANAKIDMNDAHGYSTIHYAALQGNLTSFEIVIFIFFKSNL